MWEFTTPRRAKVGMSGRLAVTPKEDQILTSYGVISHFHVIRHNGTQTHDA